MCVCVLFFCVFGNRLGKGVDMLHMESTVFSWRQPHRCELGLRQRVGNTETIRNRSTTGDRRFSAETRVATVESRI